MMANENQNLNVQLKAICYALLFFYLVGFSQKCMSFILSKVWHFLHYLFTLSALYVGGDVSEIKKPFKIV